MLDRIVAVEPRPNYHVWIRFEDGQEGEVSLAHLVGQGVFAVWEDEREFRKVYVDEDAGTIAWPGASTSRRMASAVDSTREQRWGEQNPTPVRRPEAVRGPRPPRIPGSGSVQW